MPRTDITLEEILEVHAFTTLSNVYKIFPGVVHAYYKPTQSPTKAPAMVDVQPGVNDVRFDTALGTRISEPWPIIAKVPVVFPQGGGFSMTFPLQPGDKVTLLSYDLDPTKHRGTGNVEDPIDTSRHRGSYWVAIPGDITDGGAGPDPGTSLVLRLLPTSALPNGVTIEVGSDGSVKVGAGATSVVIADGTQPVARGPDPADPLVAGDAVNAGYLVFATSSPLALSSPPYFPGTAAGQAAAQAAVEAGAPNAFMVSMDGGAITGGSSKVTSG